MRRYDLDWLRVLVFGLLIFYHAGMFFVPWEWHLKNNQLSDGLQWPMLFVNQWRLPILFIISGMGTAFAFRKRSRGQFIIERSKRLLVPLIAGIILVVPIQVYLERVAAGSFEGNYWHFFTTRAFVGVYPKGNFSWHHLWFLPYLYIFSILLAPVFHKIRKEQKNSLERGLTKMIHLPAGLYILTLPLLLTQSFLAPLFPPSHALWNDWYLLVFYSILFFYGYMLATLGNTFWQKAESNRRLYLYAGLAGFSLLVLSWLIPNKPIWIKEIQALLKILNLWSWILCIFGYASRYLNKNSTLLRYCNRAVYPFYIIHQTVTVGIGYVIKDESWGLFVKFSLLTTGTFLFTWLLYEFMIKRTPLLQPLFGLKPTKKKAKSILRQTVASAG